MQGGVEIHLRDCVELRPEADDELTRVVQIKALWSEPTQARTRMLAFCTRFYRLQVPLSHAWDLGTGKKATLSPKCNCQHKLLAGSASSGV